jgi:hypothetical protein
MKDDISPEVLQIISEAVAHQNRIDYEGAGPKAPHGAITYKDVCLSSRYDVQGEFSHMRRAIDAMPELMARRIESIWCDSKACAYYVVAVKPRLFAKGLVDEINAAFKAIGGYNGLEILRDDGPSESFDPWWPEDFMDEEV